ncbi:helix-turn-helix transcriptional regulator [Cryobacterium cheniae]|nr:helix-turn-helix transcriptional regulator [Cryobacterium cheniae]
MDKAGLVSTRWAEAAGGPPRKYYRLSDGAGAWVAMSGAMTEILGDGTS